MSGTTLIQIGIDVVDRKRRNLLVGLEAGAATHRFLTPEERRWVSEDATGSRLLVCFSVKESLMKALGRRPDGGDRAWQTVSLKPAEVVDAAIAGALEQLIPGLAAMLPSSTVATYRCRVPDGSIAGAAVVVSGRYVVVAAAVSSPVVRSQAIG